MKIAQDMLAKKYARAWINLFSQTLDVSLIDNIDTLSTYLHENRAALFYVQLAGIDDSRTRKNFEELLAHFQVGHLFESLIELLLAHKRLFLLPMIFRYLYRLYLEKYNIMHFTIESAVDLSKEELVPLKLFLAKKTGKTIIFHTEIKRDLIAGLKVYSETLGFEHSIRQRLKAFSVTGLYALDTINGLKV